ncbi:SAGA-associated factor 11 [Yarrowia sp. B02]|nr:SAGA-associated factor 11 [Yarrowia sp. B02]
MTTTDDSNSLGSLGASILLNLLAPLTEEIALGAFLKETRIRQSYDCGKAEATSAQASVASGTTKKKGSDTKGVDLQTQRLLPAAILGRDIFGRESAADSQYFECPKCMRKVAGARFCAHIERCLSGGGRSGRGSRAATSSNYSETASPGSTSPDRVRTASPGVKRGKKQEGGVVKKRRLSDGDRKSMVSKFLDRT